MANNGLYSSHVHFISQETCLTYIIEESGRFINLRGIFSHFQSFNLKCETTGNNRAEKLRRVQHWVSIGNQSLAS